MRPALPRGRGGEVERWRGGEVEWWRVGELESWSGGVVEWWSAGSYFRGLESTAVQRPDQHLLPESFL
jgi:hypothetical protein